MTAIEIAALVLLVAFALSVAATLRGDVGSRLVASQLAAVIAVLITVVLSASYGRDFYVDVAMMLVITVVIGGLVFARFLERWL
ncbi:MAG: monovalent cation/H+ antiporter complex subunit F [Actinomycetota bacterium]|nr:monovalent cation/H+ antiporter complex subunit F [Actinomycetota bacterium]